MATKILFYSSVSNTNLFNIQRFYKIDIDILESLGYEVITSNKISDAFKFWKYNSTFIYFYKYGFFTALISRILGKKVYFTGGIDELDKDYANPSHYRRQKLFFKMCRFISTRCIVVSRTDKENIQKIYNGEQPKKLVFSEHTIDIESFSQNKITKEPIFTTIGWMESPANVARKGIDTSLKLFAFLLQKTEFTAYKFIIIGKKGEGSDQLQNLANELGIADKVIFTDTISEAEKINILNRSRYYLQLSLYEGFGIAALEALAAGNIVIHSGKGGLRDTIQDFGVILDIDHPNYAEFERIYISLQEYDSTNLEFGSRMVRNRFSNKRRTDELKKIIEPL